MYILNANEYVHSATEGQAIKYEWQAQSRLSAYSEPKSENLSRLCGVKTR